MKKWYFNQWFIFFLIIFGILVFIPDPLDLIFGLGTILEAVSLASGIVLEFRRMKK